MTALAPLTDITNLRRVQSNIQAGCHQPSPVMSQGRGASMESHASTQNGAGSLSPEMMTPMSTMSHNSPSAFDFGSMPHTPVFTMAQTAMPAPAARPVQYRHDPHNWKCLPENEQQATMLLAQRASHFAATQRQRKSGPSAFHMAMPHHRHMPQQDASQHHAAPMPEVHHQHHHAPTVATNVRILVQFKCHHGEFASFVTVEKGQYVVVQGDRGMDIGVVIRVNSEAQKTYIERTGPCGSVMRHATQREVDYWASELKSDEQTALDFCQSRVAGNDLVMEVRHAEYQFDKKKLTFYYDAKSRVDFVALLKDLYREFGCRIWMEKVRPAELAASTQQ